MNKIDLFVISSPTFDSPIIRDFIHKYHSKFNKVFYVFSYSQDFNEQWLPYTTFVENDLKDKCEFIYCRMSGALNSDWRDESVHEVLKRSTGDYIFGMEPDFVGDWEKIVDIMFNTHYSLFSMVEHNITGIRLWPSFWGCKKSLLSQIKYINFGATVDERVKKLFGVDYNKRLKFDNDRLKYLNADAVKNFYKDHKILTEEMSVPHYYDHFDLVSTQLMDIIQDDGKQLLLLDRLDVYFKHFAGITHDYLMMYQHGIKARNGPSYRLFYEACMKTNVQLYSEWVDISNKILKE